MTKAGGKPRAIASATPRIWCPPVFEFSPYLSVLPLPPKFSAGNSDPAAVHWKTMVLAQSCQSGVVNMMSWSMAISLAPVGALAGVTSGRPLGPACP
jgi:hypothetical protein